MNKIALIILGQIITTLSYAQIPAFEKIITNFHMNVNPPINNIDSLKPIDTINVKTFNNLIFEERTKKIPVYKPDSSLGYTKAYKVAENPFKYTSVNFNNGEKTETTEEFRSKVFAVARLNLSQDYLLLIVKTEEFQVNAYDLYSFSRDGKLLSLVHLFHMDYDFLDDPYKSYRLVISSKISKKGIISVHEEAYDYTIDRDYELMDDGIFRIVKQKIKRE